MKKKFLVTTLAAITAVTCAFGLAACNTGNTDGNGGEKHTRHTYNQKTVNPTYLKSKADCTHKAVYYYSCICGAYGTETFEYGETAPHDFSKEEVAAKYLKSEADYTHKAVYYKSCSVCGEKGEETFEYGEVADDSKNAYQEIIDALQAKLDDEYGAGAEILTIYTYTSFGDNYLGLKIKYGNAIKQISSTIETDYFLDDMGKITYPNRVKNTIARGTLTENAYKEFVGKYFTDIKDILAEKMIEARVGTDYNIICGAVTDITEVTEGKQFKVYALIADKDGKVYEFTETLVTTGTGNAYDTVINNDRDNFESPAQTQTELGALANSYYAEQVRLAAFK